MYLEKSSRRHIGDEGQIGDAHSELIESVSQGFERVSTEHKLLRYCSDSLNMVSATEILLGQDENGKKHTMQYVPILEVINQALQNKDIVAHICQQEKSVKDSDIMFDHDDGLFFTEHSFFQVHQFFQSYDYISILTNLRYPTHLVQDVENISKVLCTSPLAIFILDIGLN